MKQLKCKGTQLFFRAAALSEKAEALGGLASVDVTDYDHIICAGMCTTFHIVVMYQRLSLLPGQTGDTNQYVSEDAYGATWKERFAASPLHNMLNMLKLAGAPSVHVAFKPMVSAELAQGETRTAKYYRSLVEGTETSARIWSVVRRANTEVLGDAHYKPQPDDTMLGGVLTKEEYSVGSTRLMKADKEHDAEDYRHMNGDFGAAYLRHHLPRLNPQTGADA